MANVSDATLRKWIHLLNSSQDLRFRSVTASMESYLGQEDTQPPPPPSEGAPPLEVMGSDSVITLVYSESAGLESVEASTNLRSVLEGAILDEHVEKLPTLCRVCFVKKEVPE